jgi:hypothetical protein
MYAGITKNAVTGTLAAGVAADVDIPTLGASRLAIVVKNTGGSNAIGTVALLKSPRGGLFEPPVFLTTIASRDAPRVGMSTSAATPAATALIGSLAVGASALVELTDLMCQTVRLTLTSASGSTYAVEYWGG